MNCTHSRDYLFKLLNNCTANSKVCHFFVFMENGGQMQLAVTYRAAERGGREIGFWGPLEFFCWGAKGKIFVFFGQSTQIWYEKLGGGGGCCSGKNFVRHVFTSDLSD